MSYITNIIKKTEENTNFRTVLFTGQRSQLVVMNIPIGGEIGEEIHSHVEQTLFFMKGKAKAILDGKETEVSVGDVMVVTPETRHNVVNAGTEPLLIYTVYAPANHIDGRVHKTKKDADADVEDEIFGKDITT
jgi:mannose-6-phosphate isomerase-like protein (cupin superfamily)